MGGKRNKIRYTSKPKARVAIIITGEIFLRFVDDDAIALAKKGDLQVFPCNESLCTTRQGEYDANGFAGYFKVDVYDGREWQPVILQEIFPDRLHYFSKTEYPIDTYALCRETLKALTGRSLVRKYREHYELEDVAEPDDAEE